MTNQPVTVDLTSNIVQYLHIPIPCPSCHRVASVSLAALLSHRRIDCVACDTTITFVVKGNRVEQLAGAYDQITRQLGNIGLRLQFIQS